MTEIIDMSKQSSNAPDNLFLQFCTVAYQNGLTESQKNSRFKVRLMAFYVAGFFASYCALLFLPNDQPSEKYSWSFLGKLAGSIAVVLTCLLQIFGAVNDKSLSSSLGPARKRVSKVGESEKLALAL